METQAEYKVSSDSEMPMRTSTKREFPALSSLSQRCINE